MIKRGSQTVLETLVLIFAIALLAPTFSARANTEAEADISKIQALLPKNFMLRDYERVPGTEKFLVIYIVDPKIEEHGRGDTYSTCPPLVNG